MFGESEVAEGLGPSGRAKPRSRSAPLSLRLSPAQLLRFRVHRLQSVTVMSILLSRHLRTHLIVAPSTSVGKSIFATGLCRASLSLGEKVAYLKPVGTGSGDGDDEACVFLPRALPLTLR